MDDSGKRKILVIDDSETNLILLQTILEEAGYEVELSDDSSVALDYIRARKPDLVLLDLLMPGMGGIEFLEQLNNGSDSLPAPVLVITAYASREYNERAKALGALDIIDKPIDITTILMQISRIVH